MLLVTVAYFSFLFFFFFFGLFSVCDPKAKNIFSTPQQPLNGLGQPEARFHGSFGETQTFYS